MNNTIFDPTAARKAAAFILALSEVEARFGLHLDLPEGGVTISGSGPRVPFTAVLTPPGQGQRHLPGHRGMIPVSPLNDLARRAVLDVAATLYGHESFPAFIDADLDRRGELGSRPVWNVVTAAIGPTPGRPHRGV